MGSMSFEGGRVSASFHASDALTRICGPLGRVCVCGAESGNDAAHRGEFINYFLAKSKDLDSDLTLLVFPVDFDFGGSSSIEFSQKVEEGDNSTVKGSARDF
ncbi:hypothetical protein NL676_036788 [Syzygium grande]|nr:hypothetical protein NL676_036788 [Syzygium grande]